MARRFPWPNDVMIERGTLCAEALSDSTVVVVRQYNAFGDVGATHPTFQIQLALFTAFERRPGRTTLEYYFAFLYLQANQRPCFKGGALSQIPE